FIFQRIFDVIAIDGPLLPNFSFDDRRRICESILSRGRFQRRCKPGFSHFGLGLQFRQAAHRVAGSVAAHARLINAGHSHLLSGPAVVEAFPNAFLGVLLSDDEYAQMPKLRRGQKFDWLYDRAVATGALLRVMDQIAWQDKMLATRVQTEKDHDKRAALICLLTAGSFAAGKATPVGDALTGHIWLPPAPCIADWAKRQLDI
ncbi:MAG: DUF429 domain-containing protein, partial [Beijerinckiaceae bacterium]